MGKKKIHLKISSLVLLYTAAVSTFSSTWFEVRKEKNIFHADLCSSQMIAMNLTWAQEKQWLSPLALFIFCSNAEPLSHLVWGKVSSAQSCPSSSAQSSCSACQTWGLFYRESSRVGSKKPCHRFLRLPVASLPRVLAFLSLFPKHRWSCVVKWLMESIMLMW